MLNRPGTALIRKKKSLQHLQSGGRYRLEIKEEISVCLFISLVCYLWVFRMLSLEN